MMGPACRDFANDSTLQTDLDEAAHREGEAGAESPREQVRALAHDCLAATFDSPTANPTTPGPALDTLQMGQVRSSLWSLWVCAADQPTGNEGFPAVLGLRQPVGEQMQHGRIVPKAVMAAEDLDILAMLPRAETAGLPRHDPITAGVHRRRGHAQRTGFSPRSGEHRRRHVQPSQPIECGRCRAAAPTGQPYGTAQGHDLAHAFR